MCLFSHPLPQEEQCVQSGVLFGHFSIRTYIAVCLLKKARSPKHTLHLGQKVVRFLIVLIPVEVHLTISGWPPRKLWPLWIPCFIRLTLTHIPFYLCVCVCCSFSSLDFEALWLLLCLRRLLLCPLSLVGLGPPFMESKQAARVQQASIHQLLGLLLRA